MESNFQQCIVIILAGGESKRAEAPKGLRKYKSMTWIRHCIDHYLKIGFNSVFVGLGYHADRYKKEIAIKKSKKIMLTINPEPERGPFSTLRETLIHALARPNWEHCIIQHIDRPLFSSSFYTKLVDLNKCLVSKPTFNGKSGHPIRLHRRLCQDIVHQPDDYTLRDILKLIPFIEINYVEFEEANIHLNFNTKSDWENYLAENKN